MLSDSQPCCLTRSSPGARYAIALLTHVGSKHVIHKGFQRAFQHISTYFNLQYILIVDYITISLMVFWYNLDSSWTSKLRLVAVDSLGSLLATSGSPVDQHPGSCQPWLFMLQPSPKKCLNPSESSLFVIRVYVLILDTGVANNINNSVGFHTVTYHILATASNQTGCTKFLGSEMLPHIATGVAGQTSLFFDLSVSRTLS